MVTALAPGAQRAMPASTSLSAASSAAVSLQARSTSPIRSTSSPVEAMRGQERSRRVRATPMRAATNGAIWAGGTPSVVSEIENFASASRQHHVAAAHQPKPAAIGRAFDHHHDRLRQRLEARHDRAETAVMRRDAVLLPRFRGGRFKHFLEAVDVAAGAERAVGAADHRRADAVVGGEQIGYRGQVAHHRLAKRVARLRPVEPDEQDIARAFQQQRFEGRKG